MASISAFGTDYAARTRGWAHLTAPLLILLLTANTPPPPGAVDIHFEGLRSAKGLIRACLTREPRFFPHCEKDAGSFKRSIPAAVNATIHFAGVAPGDYAITVLHDENSNAKADMMLGIPREGVGFSQNPRLITGPPKFAAARFHVGDGAVTQTIHMKYFL